MSAETWGPELDGEVRQREQRADEIDAEVGNLRQSADDEGAREEIRELKAERRRLRRTFTVRLSLEAQGLYLTYTDVPGQDADEAAAKAVKKAETECATEGFVLDGPVAEEGV